MAIQVVRLMCSLVVEAAVLLLLVVRVEQRNPDMLVVTVVLDLLLVFLDQP